MIVLGLGAVSVDQSLGREDRASVSGCGRWHYSTYLPSVSELLSSPESLSAEPQDTGANASSSPERCLRLQIPPPQLLRRQISRLSIVAKETQTR